jgi:hypothetical protein
MKSTRLNHKPFRKEHQIKKGEPTMKKLLLSLAVMSLIVPSAQAATGADVLRSLYLPRVIGMGGAFTAAADDVNSVNTNPAGLARVGNTQLSLSHNITLIDSLEYLALAQPLQSGGVLGASLIYRQAPDVNNDGALDATVASNDLVVSVGYGSKLGGLFNGGQEWSLGLNLKWLRSVLGDYNAGTVAADLGLQWSPQALPDLQVGLAARNLGAPIKYLDVQDNLPWTTHLGVSYQVVNQPQNKLSVSAEGGLEQAGEKWLAGAGAEYWLQELLALRVGYQYQPDSLASVIYAGAGVKFAVDTVRLEADYAYKPVLYSSKTMEAEHFIALTLGF